MGNLDDYLDHIYDKIDPQIKLDNEQKAAVVGEEERALVIAGAGTGKTTTVAAKVKYLVDIKKIPAEKILVMSYTRKSVEELERRINVDLEIPAKVTTFHSLGLSLIRQLETDKKVIPIDGNERHNLFLDYLKERIFTSRDEIDKMVRLFNDEEISWPSKTVHTYGSFFLENYKSFSSFDEYFDAYIERKIRETPDIIKRSNDITDQKLNNDVAPITIRGERVKSKGEAVIANFLLCNNIDYAYERVYEELVGEHQVYRPDFSIDVGGEKIYIEYFGMSGGDLDNRSYQRIRKMKEEYHRRKRNKFIALDYAPNRGYLKVLKEQLQQLGVKLYPKSDEEIYRILLMQNPLAEFYNLEKFVYGLIDTIKASEKVQTFEEYRLLCNSFINLDDTDERDFRREQLEWVSKYWEYYHQAKSGDQTKLKVDYADMIKLPQGRLKEIRVNYDYVIVDEYQDISAARFELLKEVLERTGAKFFAIGDDWQSIYSFQGAKVGYILDFEKYFPGAKRYIISNTYRNAQTLIDSAGKFVMRNVRQVRKDLKSHKDLDQPICFVRIGRSLKTEQLPVEVRNNLIEMMIKEIHAKHPKDSICVLGRTNEMVGSLFRNPNFTDSAESKVRIKGVEGFYFDAMTIHKSKGLTYDWTIILPLTKSFPRMPRNFFWMADIVRNEPEAEGIEYAEQRRLFYVALTRTKNRVYILLPDKGEHSIYKDELKMIIDAISSKR